MHSACCLLLIYTCMWGWSKVSELPPLDAFLLAGIPLLTFPTSSESSGEKTGHWSNLVGNLWPVFVRKQIESLPAVCPSPGVPLLPVGGGVRGLGGHRAPQPSSPTLQLRSGLVSVCFSCPLVEDPGPLCSPSLESLLKGGCAACCSQGCVSQMATFQNK